MQLCLQRALGADEGARVNFERIRDRFEELIVSQLIDSGVEARMALQLEGSSTGAALFFAKSPRDLGHLAPASRLRRKALEMELSECSK
jgi:hypothetical protein